jgi:hypothetical protein
MGGLVTSTLLTLLVLPAVYALFAGPGRPGDEAGWRSSLARLARPVETGEQAPPPS